MDHLAGLALTKQSLRAEARRRRRALAEKDSRSREIHRRVAALDEYAAARTILFYVDTDDEVRTRPLIEEALASGRRVAVPYCEGKRLLLFHLTRMDELATGRFGILEPRQDLRGLAGRQVDARDAELALVPGVAFDALGHRLGQGAGYYDRFLPTLGRGVPRVGLAFACQVFDAIPAGPHDVPMDMIVTEEAVLRRPGSES